MIHTVFCQWYTLLFSVSDTHCIFCEWYTLCFLWAIHTVFSVSDLGQSKGSQVNPQFKVNTVTLIVCDIHCVFCECYRTKWRQSSQSTMPCEHSQCDFNCLWNTLCFLSVFYDKAKTVKSIHNSMWTEWFWMSVEYTVFSVNDLQQSKSSQINPQFNVNRAILIVCGIYCVFHQWFRTKQRQSSQSTIQCVHSDRDYLGYTLCL